MNYDQMTLKTQDAIQEAGNLAMQKSSSEIGNEHLLTAMLRQKDGTIPPLVERIGVQPETLLSELGQLIDQYPTVSGNTQMTLSSEAQRTLALAEKEMASLKDLYLSTEHLFLAMTEAKD
ncbi:MAG: type VI secretion system ATPase TssH, partial [Treponema sp.]|nr:type VI secretion system ATPase TssH [Treponema sp.]